MARHKQNRAVTDETVRTVGFFLGMVMVTEQTVATLFGVAPSWIIMIPASVFFLGPTLSLALLRAYRGMEDDDESSPGGEGVDRPEKR